MPADPAPSSYFTPEEAARALDESIHDPTQAELDAAAEFLARYITWLDDEGRPIDPSDLPRFGLTPPPQS